ncbi:MAG: HPr family phosphocarrier protein [Rhizobiaceae bacterium]
MPGKLKPRTRRMAIVNKRGLHARASARFVETVASFDAAIEVEKDGITVGGTSIMGLMMLAASPGCLITVHASGSEAEAALEALDKLVSAGFGEES